jgi:hypothetical protein
MSASTFALLYAAIAGVRASWVWVALGLLMIEITVFVGSGMKCPFTAAAMRYGARLGDDTFFPEPITRHTLRFFSPLIVISLLLLTARWAGVLH